MRFYVVFLRYMTGVSLCLHLCCSLFDSVMNDRDHKPHLIKHYRMSIVEHLYKVDFFLSAVIYCCANYCCLCNMIMLICPVKLRIMNNKHNNCESKHNNNCQHKNQGGKTSKMASCGAIAATSARTCVHKEWRIFFFFLS